MSARRSLLIRCDELAKFTAQGRRSTKCVAEILTTFKKNVSRRAKVVCASGKPIASDSPDPGRIDRILRSSLNSNEIVAPGIVGGRHSGDDTDAARDQKAYQDRLEIIEDNRTSGGKSDYRTGKNRERRAQAKRERALPHKLSVPSKTSEAQRQHRLEKLGEQ